MVICVDFNDVWQVRVPHVVALRSNNENTAGNLFLYLPIEERDAVSQAVAAIPTDDEFVIHTGASSTSLFSPHTTADLYRGADSFLVFNDRASTKSQAIAPIGSAGRVLCASFFVLARDGKGYGDAGQVWTDGLVFAASDASFHSIKAALIKYINKSITPP